MRSLNDLVWRSLLEHRIRTALSAVAVALGVAMIIANGVILTGFKTVFGGEASVLSEFVETMLGIAFTSVGMVILAAAGFLVYNAFAMSVTQRSRELGSLRALGMTRRQALRHVLLEAGATGVLGVVLGLIGGPLLGAAVLAAMRQTGLEAGPGQIRLADVVLGIGTGLGVTLLAALRPAWRAGRTSPLEAMLQPTTAGDKHPHPFRAILGAILAVGLTLYLIAAPPGEWAGASPPWDLILTFVLWAAWIAAFGLAAPALIRGIIRLLRGPLRLLWKTTGRLAADNLTRSPERVTTTVLTFAIGIATMVAIAGLSTFNNGLVRVNAERYQQSMSWSILPFDNTSGLAGFNSMSAEEFQLKPQVIADMRAAAAGRALLAEQWLVVVPEISPVVRGFPSLMTDVETLMYPGAFAFSEGDWDSALPVMQSGCGLLLPPSVATRNGVGVGDTISVQGLNGPVACTVAGIGSGGVQSTTVISIEAKQSFVPADRRPDSLEIRPLPGVDIDTLDADLRAVVERHEGDAWIVTVDDQMRGIETTSSQFQGVFNGLVLFAVIAAALGMINTTMISVAERRREIGLLRAVGMTRRQAAASVTGEAALMGLIGAALGALLGAGLGLLYGLAQGGLGFGVVDLPLWPAALRAVPPALANGAFGIALSPLLAAGAAYLVVRSILRGTPIDTMDATREPQPETRARPVTVVSLDFLAWRNLGEHRLRTGLSMLAVALGVAMTIAADVIGGAIVNSLSESEDVQTIAAGIFGQLETFFGVVGVAITAAAGFLVFNAFLMSVTQRRQQIGALRSLGMTRRQIMRLVLAEALMAGGLGTLIGLIGGPLLGRGLIALLRLSGNPIFSKFTESTASLGTVLLAAGLGLGVTLLAVLIPAWQAARISPLAALHEPETGEGGGRRAVLRAGVGVILILAMAAWVILAPPSEWVTYPWDLRLTGLFALAWLLALGLILPAAIGGAARLARRLLSRSGAVGRLVADNLGRGRTRVALTVATLGVGLGMIVGLTGALTFMFNELFGPSFQHAGEGQPLGIMTFHLEEGPAGYADRDTLQLPPEADSEVRTLVGERGTVNNWYYVSVPELALLPNYFSYVFDPRSAQRIGNAAFAFSEGDWEHAVPLMEEDCGVLISPLVAQRNGVGLYDTLTVTGANGPVQCTVAGIGQATANASVIGLGAREEFGVEQPLAILISPAPNVDRNQLKAKLQAYAVGKGLVLVEIGNVFDAIEEATDSLGAMLNALLLLAIFAAALGVVNTTVMSVAERRHEFGLLRAVGATRRQVIRVVAGEAALMGLIGALLGLAAGAGLTVILVTVYGGNAWGLPDLDLWPAAWRSLRPGLINGLVGIAVAPVICAAAAYLPARRILRGAAIETIQPERHIATSPRQAVAGFLGRGSLRTRFVLGTAALMFVVLFGLITLVTAHARLRMEEQMRDGLRSVVTWNAGLVELTLPEDAQTLSLDALMSSQGLPLDSEAMLRFRSLIDEMTANGLREYAIADQDNTILLSLDERQIGDHAPDLGQLDQPQIVTESDGDEWLYYAAAPIRSEAGTQVGTVRLTVDGRGVQSFLSRLRGLLWTLGAAVIAGGVAVSWALATPLVRASQQLAAHAAEVKQGALTLFEPPRRSRALSRFSLRTRLTVAMTLIIVSMVALLEIAVIPLERRHVEGLMKDTLASSAEWVGQVASDSFADEQSAGSLDMAFTLDQALDATETLDMARLQELGEQIRSEDMAFIALVAVDGTIVGSSQLAQMGESAPVSAETVIEDGSWRGDPVWIVSTPLRRGREGEQIGTLRMAMRRERIELFLGESRTLFRLAGLIAILGGVLLAQAIGGVVAAPVQQLAAGTRRIAAGDLSVRFQVDGGDELAALANAYNEMVAGLREREWLRDMFGRFVSQEVAEAIRSGQVRLEGENRVVSVLFCDIRDFHPPLRAAQPRGGRSALERVSAGGSGCGARPGGNGQ